MGDIKGWGPPPEFDPQTNTYTYGMGRYQDGECKTNPYFMLKIKPNKNEEGFPGTTKGKKNTKEIKKKKEAQTK